LPIHGPDQLVPGDCVHGAVADGDAFTPRFARWQARHRELAVEVVAGNHDDETAMTCGVMDAPPGLGQARAS